VFFVENNPIIRAISAKKLVENDDCYMESVSGKKILVSISATPTFAKVQPTEAKKDLAVEVSDQQELESIVIVFRDVSEERADQNQQTEFISTASHEMRTPVAIIEGYIGMLMNPATATVDSRGLAYAKKAHEAAQHLGRLFQDLLDVTKADDRRTLTNCVLLNATDAAKEVVNEFQNMATTKNLKLVFRENSVANERTIQPLYMIYVDYDQFKEILGNLIENALKYTKIGGVEVSVVEQSGRIKFEVKDTGIGIPAEDTSHLFQKFYRVDNSDTREIGGTGLGLYLIKKLAENMSGQVGVESVYGKGSTFWVEFQSLSREEAILKAKEMRQREMSGR
jgi:signal transduction histidine kinase